MTATAAIAVHGLHKSFGGKPVLHGLDLQVAPGEFLGLVGPNGAGKSTLLRILIGLYQPTDGAVSVCGLDPTRQALAVRRRCSYLPGETSVYQQMTGADFLAFAQSFQHRRDAATEQRLRALFALPLTARVRSYSAGMKQKLAVLAALSADSDVYLLDEPDRALDATMRMELRQVLESLRAAGKTVILSSHHLEELRVLATRLEFLREGRLVAHAEVEAARAELAHRFRVRLRTATPLPPGARTLGRDGDGSLLLESDEPPADWMRRLPPGAVLAAELGSVSLEDLYDRLYLQGTAREPAP
ncbi:MAG: ABC transporter ATP-binding protein [Planctomycetota bacterium]